MKSDCIDRVKALGLRGSLVAQEVHVVDDEQIEPSRLSTKSLNIPLADRRDEFVRELLASRVAHLCIRLSFQKSTADRLKQMGLADTA